MKKLPTTIIVLTAIGVAARALKTKTITTKVWPKGMLDVNHSMTIGSKDSYPQWVQDKFFVS